jgi:tetratricopeptide (TPR) repeat protein
MARLFICFILTLGSVYAQENFKREMYLGNYYFDQKEYADAIDHFDEIIDESPLNYKANFNKGNALFRQKKYAKAAEIFETITGLAPSRLDKSKVFHNLGNSHLMAGQIDNAIEAYKDALRLNPGDEDTRYNLAYAQKLKREQQQNQPQQQENPNGDENGNGDENSDKNENGNENANDKEKQEDKNGDGQPDDPKNGDEENNEQEPGEGDEKENENNSDGQPETRKMSHEEARRLRETAIRNEKAVMEKLLKEKLFANGKSRKKDW